MNVELSNTFLLFTQAVVYFVVMVGLLDARRKIGVGVFMTALGVMHFLETYLASVFYIQLPFGILSPGSTILFSGKLLMLLLLYIKEDAFTARQPIYGLLFGNFLIVGLVMILRNHETMSVVSGRAPDIAFIDEIGWLMVWGTVLLFIDAIAIILLYEKLGRWLRKHLALRFFICGAVILTFDQLGFFLALSYVSGAPFAVLFGGWAAKISAAAVYSLMFVGYLRFVSRPLDTDKNLMFKDVFHTLTYRERYEDLLERSSHDVLTGAFDRGRFEVDGPELFRKAQDSDRPLSLLMIDVDHFKEINDGYGHAAGDQVLKMLVETLSKHMRSDDILYRYGGEEFVVFSANLPHEAAISVADRWRRVIGEVIQTELGKPVTVCIGVATSKKEMNSVQELFSQADDRLYEAKRAGRNRVCGEMGGVKAGDAFL